MMSPDLQFRDHLFSHMTALSVRLRPSIRLTAILSTAHGIAFFLLCLLPLSMGIQLIGAAALACSLAFNLGRYGLLNMAGAIVAFELSDELRCTLETRCGGLMVCTILASTFVASYLIVMNLKPDNYFFSRSIVILPDGIDAEEFRQLRVLLRWKWKNGN